REALVHRLVSDEPRRLTLVSAPAGWGKTTLLAEWAADSREQRPFAWLTLDRGDNDAVRFWGYAIEALRTLEPSIGSASLAALGVSGTNPLDVVLPPLINELAALDRRLVLALEDYHLIQSPEVHEGLTFLVERLHRGVRGRRPPHRRLPRRRGTGRARSANAQVPSPHLDPGARLRSTL